MVVNGMPTAVGTNPKNFLFNWCRVIAADDGQIDSITPHVAGAAAPYAGDLIELFLSHVANVHFVADNHDARMAGQRVLLIDVIAGL